MMSISVHGIKTLSAEYKEVKETYWVDLILTNKYNVDEEFCLFFEEPALGQAFTDAINNLEALITRVISEGEFEE